MKVLTIFLLLFRAFYLFVPSCTSCDSEKFVPNFCPLCVAQTDLVDHLRGDTHTVQS